MINSSRAAAGVDTGGTFTDVASYDGRAWRFAKTLTTPREPRLGIIDALSRVADGRLDMLGTVVHGTTLVANAIIERKGSRVGLVTTSGFRDVLEIGSEYRYDLFDLFIDRPPSLVPRSRRVEVKERIRADGEVAVALDELSVMSATTALANLGCEAIAVCLLHSYRNAEHEQRVGAALEKALPHVDISLSSRISPEMGEYVRTVTTVANAYVRPLVRAYLTDLDRSLRTAGFEGQLYLMESNGAVVNFGVASEAPINLVESGPAAGAIAAATQGRLGGYPDLISFDMGGTTAKMCVIRNGQPSRSSEFEVARLHRFKKGSGLPVQVSVVEMIEIGAGGGSIAGIDKLGLLRVGPESSGADPGPACYGRGGASPTVTDADLVLGYLNPDFFLGGEMKLNADAARTAIAEGVGSPLGFEVTEAAWGLVDVVNSNMASAMRLHVVERGFDPSRFDLFAFGGAGPVHAYDLARRLGLRRVVVPPGAGVASAIGLLAAPRAIELSRSRYARLSRMDRQQSEAVLEVFATLERTALDAMRQMDDMGEIEVSKVAEMRYVGQGHTLPVVIPATRAEEFPAQAKGAFDQAYAARYGRGINEAEVEVLTLRVWAEEAGGRTMPDLDGPTRQDRSLLPGHRLAYFPEANGFMQCSVYRRGSLKPGDRMKGPLLIEDWSSTIVAGPRATIDVDGGSNVVITLPR